MALITNETLAKVKREIELRNNRLKDFVDLYAASTWDTVQLDVQLGNGPTKYPIGTQLVCGYTVDGVKYDCPWIVVAHREVEDENGNKHPGMVLQMAYGTVEDIQFDAAEGVVITSADDTTAEEGYYYCGISGSTYTLLNLAAGDAIPFGGYDSIRKGTIGHKDVYQYGYNRYRDSAHRQWLNSSADKGEWWQSTHYGDNAPSQLATRKGFIAGLDADFAAVIKPVKIQVAANTVTDGGDVDVMYDRFFLPSIEEIYGVPQLADVEGAYWPYWKTVLGLDAPSNAAMDGRKKSRISTPSGGAVALRLRSAYRGHSNHAWNVYAGGTLSNGTAFSSYSSQPACVIY